MDRPNPMLIRLLAVTILASPLLCAAGYAVGRYRGQTRTIPLRPIFQLVDHRRHCLGQDRQRIRAELTGALPLAPWAWEEILTMQRPIARPRGRGA